MAATMDAVMFIMINMYGYMCAYVFVHAYMCACAWICIQVWNWQRPTLTPTQPYLPRGDPLTQYQI